MLEIRYTDVFLLIPRRMTIFLILLFSLCLLSILLDSPYYFCPCKHFFAQIQHFSSVDCTLYSFLLLPTLHHTRTWFSFVPARAVLPAMARLSMVKFSLFKIGTTLFSPASNSKKWLSTQGGKLIVDPAVEGKEAPQASFCQPAVSGSEYDVTGNDERTLLFCSSSAKPSQR